MASESGTIDKLVQRSTPERRSGLERHARRTSVSHHAGRHVLPPHSHRESAAPVPQPLAHEIPDAYPVRDFSVLSTPSEAGHVLGADALLLRDVVMERYKLLHPDQKFPWGEEEFGDRLTRVVTGYAENSLEAAELQLLLHTYATRAKGDSKIEALKDRLTQITDRLYTHLASDTVKEDV